jgi:hypothetical protein
VAGEFAVGAGEEVVALGVVLADEQNVGRLGAPAEFGVAPPPGEVGVVAAELVVVLVGAAGAVELEQKQPRLVPCLVGEFRGWRRGRLGADGGRGVLRWTSGRRGAAGLGVFRGVG